MQYMIHYKANHKQKSLSPGNEINMARVTKASPTLRLRTLWRSDICFKWRDISVLMLQICIYVDRMSNFSFKIILTDYLKVISE